jgi:hypothetical protein
VSTVRSVSGATLVALAVPLALAAPLAGVAAATAVGSPTIVYAADLDRDGAAGLYRATVADPTTKTAILADNGSVAVTKAILSPGGTRIAVLAQFSSANPGQQLVTMNLDGSNRHTVVSELISSTQSKNVRNVVDGFAWKGNGSLVYGWSQSTFTTTTFTGEEDVWTVPANGGTPTKIAGTLNMGDPTASPDGTQVAAVNFAASPMALQVFPAAGGTKVTVATEASSYLYSPVWSPDGSSIAFVRDATTDTLDASQIDVVRYYTGTSSWSAASSAVALKRDPSSSWIDADPQWSDANTLLFERIDDSSSAVPSNQFEAPIDLWSATYDTGTAAWPADATKLAATPDVDEWAPSTGAVDVTAPSPVSFQPFGLGGTSVTVRWTSPDTDYSHVTLHRTDGSAAPAVDIPNVFGTSYVDTNLTVGTTYTYTATAFDGAGNQAASDSAAQMVTATKGAKIVAVTPTSATGLGLPFRVTWGVAGQPAGTTYDVDYAVKGGTKWALGTTYHWLTGTAATYGTFKGVAGQTYYFRATVHDTHTNAGSTPWSGVNVPLDQTAGTFSRGWVTIKNSRAYWLGSIASTGTNGATFTVSPTSKSISIVGDKCAKCGKVAVYVDGRYRGTVSTAANTTKFRQVLWTGVNAAIGKHTVKLVAILAKGQVLHVDGVADPR